MIDSARMDVKLTKELTEVLVDGKVAKTVHTTNEEFGKYMTELIGDDNIMLEAMRFCHRKIKVVSTTFKDVK